MFARIEKKKMEPGLRPHWLEAASQKIDTYTPAFLFFSGTLFFFFFFSFPGLFVELRWSGHVPRHTSFVKKKKKRQNPNFFIFFFFTLRACTHRFESGVFLALQPPWCRVSGGGGNGGCDVLCWEARLSGLSEGRSPALSDLPNERL